MASAAPSASAAPPVSDGPLSSTAPSTSAEPKLPKTVLEDHVRPDEDTNFAWPRTPQSDCWRLLLNGTVENRINSSIANNWKPDLDSSIAVLGSLVQDGKGINLLNTIERVHERKMAVVKQSVVFALAYCSCSINPIVKSRAFEVMPKVCSESSPFLMFVDLREKVHKHLRSTTGWGKAMRRAVKKWYQHRPPMYLTRSIMECPRYNKWHHRDVLRLCHIAPSNNEEKMLFSILVAGLQKTIVMFKNEMDKDLDESQKLLRFAEKALFVRSAESASNIVSLMDDMKLSWQFVPTSLYQEAELWEQMVSEVPFGVMIRNTVRMAKMELLEGNTRAKDVFKTRCADQDLVSQSGMHPYEIFEEMEYYRDGMDRKKHKPTWKIDPDVTSALNTAMLTAMASNLKPTGKRFFITIDSSDSMKAHIANNDRVQCRLTAALMTLCLVKPENKTVVKAFSASLNDIPIEATTTISDVAKQLDETPLGGCDCSRPLIEAKTSKIKIDVFVIFTDKETWKGKTSPTDALKQYRKELKIPAKLIMVTLCPDKKTDLKSVVSSDDRGILQIYGFSAAMTRVMRNFALYPY